MRRNLVAAFIVAALAVLWLGYGVWSADAVDLEHETLLELRDQSVEALADSEPTAVRARVSTAQEQERTVVLRGRTENKRTVVVKAEISGRVERRVVDEGARVKAGDPLCLLDDDERAAKVYEAQRILEQAEIDFKGRKQLQQQNFQSESDIAAARATVAIAQSRLTEATKNFERVTIRAPFDGIVETAFADVGDFLNVGSACATLIDLDPMLVVAEVAEKDVHRFSVGLPTTATLPSGRLVAGEVTFLGNQANDATRTFRIEVSVPNPSYLIRSGLTAAIEVPLERFKAHKVSTALFALDDLGQIGVRTVNSEQRVEFNPVMVVREATDGVWVSGLPEIITLITVGQDFVISGERVEVQYVDEG